jgi:hypothetical protein
MESTEEGGHHAQKVRGARPIRQILMIRRQLTPVEPEDERLPLRFPWEDIQGLRQELPDNTLHRRPEVNVALGPSTRVSCTCFVRRHSCSSWCPVLTVLTIPRHLIRRSGPERVHFSNWSSSQMSGTQHTQSPRGRPLNHRHSLNYPCPGALHPLHFFVTIPLSGSRTKCFTSRWSRPR